MQINTLLQETVDIAQKAGQIISSRWEKARDIKKKGRIDLVTDTDLAVEAYLKKALADLMPNADFLAEESASSLEIGGNKTWIIDPLDGTTNFAHHIPMVAVSIALWEKNSPLLGVIHLPILNETFCAAQGQGAHLNGQRIQTTSNVEMENALVATGFPYSIDRDVDEVLAPLRRILVAARGVRRPGSAATDLAYLACGRYDAFYELGLKPWDTAAGLVLVQEAGGRVTRFDGSPYAPGDRDILATNKYMHPEMVRILKAGDPETKND